MSIDIHYNSYDPGNPPITYDFLMEAIEGKFNLVKYQKEENGVISGFSLEPVDSKLKHPKGVPYEFFLQEDGSYWYRVLTREKNDSDIENEALGEIEVLLRWEDSFLR